MKRAHGLRPIIPALAAVAIALVIPAAGRSPALAECDGPIPEFRHVLTNARQVVIGDVVAVQPDPNEAPLLDGRSTHFTVQVRVVLRGTAPPLLAIHDLATQHCSVALMARLGDRIVLALDGTDFSPPVPANVAAWIRGEPPPWDGFEKITEAEVANLLGVTPAALGPGDGAPAGPGDRSDQLDGLAILAGSALAAGVLIFGVIGIRRRGSHGAPRT